MRRKCVGPVLRSIKALEVPNQAATAGTGDPPDGAASGTIPDQLDPHQCSRVIGSSLCNCGTGWASIRFIKTPTPISCQLLSRHPGMVISLPSNTPRRIPQPIADPNADLGPAVQ